MSGNVEKLIIIGSGPAGYTAAIYSSRAMLKPLLFEGEQPGGQLMITSDVENYPGFAEGITGPELMEVMRKQAERFGTRFITKNITKVDFSTKPLKVWEGSNVYQAHAVIIATGASAKWLGIEGEKAYSGKGVSACATCDGAFFKNVDVAVVGGGDTAMEEALFMTRYASKVYVIHRRDEFRASKIMAERVVNHPKIQVMWNSEVHDIKGDQNVKSIELKNVKTGALSQVPVEGVFIAIGHEPNSEIFKKFIHTEETGYLKIKHGSSYTNIDGVFAAGDIHDHIYRQAVTAAGAGCMSAIDAERWLERQGL